MPDWNAILRDYPAAVTAVAGLIGIILTFVFTRWNAQRNRNWELEDRDLNSRAESKKRKVEETRLHIDNLLSINQKVVQYQYKIISNEEIETYEKEYQNITEMFEPTASKAVSITFLDDKALTELHTRTLLLFSNEFHRLDEIKQSIRNGQRLDKQELLQKLSIVNNDLGDLIREMYKRLDAISKTPL